MKDQIIKMDTEAEQYKIFLQNLTIKSKHPAYLRICKKCNEEFCEQRNVKDERYIRFFAENSYLGKHYYWCLACIQTELLLPSHD